ncbi:AraC family transcriptional regulator [Rugosimonospora acidiphila]|uniref:AraC family transcriptional regulator n=1 Tax=Rugosimonospora acidiphila TaxID=556531 RepID=A0ABP9S205_9ACTN
MATLTHLHSVPAGPQPAPCESVVRPPHPRLRPYVLGYGGFRSGSGQPVRHRILPMNLTTLIIDLDGPYGLVTGARGTASTQGQTGWGHGVSVGLTPAGVSALLGVPMPELAGRTARLADVLGHRAAELAERLAAAPDFPSRFALLDDRLAAWAVAGRSARWAAKDRPRDQLITEAWWRLQRGTGRPRVGTVAGELGVSRRYLEVGFRRRIGLSPATVARVARFQRAVHLLGTGTDLPRTAIESGYADQPHLTRETRAMAGVTPRQLCAFLQDVRAAHA